MSIIQEALKKVQANIDYKSTPKEQLKRPEAISRIALAKNTFQVTKKISKTKNASGFLIPLLSIFFILFAVLLFHFLGLEKYISKHGKKNAARIPASASYQEVTYRPISNIESKSKAVLPGTVELSESLNPGVKIKYPELVLNGIMYLEGGPRAIINNSIVEEGDAVSGANIRKINRKSVVLEYDGVEIVLNLKT